MLSPVFSKTPVTVTPLTHQPHSKDNNRHFHPYILHQNNETGPHSSELLSSVAAEEALGWVLLHIAEVEFLEGRIGQ